jgi:hypothetical protein
MDAYELHEGRLIQDGIAVSVADVLYAALGPVPVGKVWSILSASLYPSVSETRMVWFSIRARSGMFHPVTVPVSNIAAPGIPYPMLTMGMEVKLFPGEYLFAYRDVATAGSTITLRLRFIDSDLPYYSYVEPLAKVVQQAQRRGSITRASSVGAAIAAPSGVGRPGGGGGKKGEPQPI